MLLDCIQHLFKILKWTPYIPDPKLIQIQILVLFYIENTPWRFFNKLQNYNIYS